MSLLPERPRQSLFSSRGPAGGRTPYAHHSRLRSPTWRPKPYDKPVQPPPPANPEARWNHDLFEDDSNLYGPRVKYHVHPLKSVVSHPLPVKPQSDRTNSHSGISLLSRIQSNAPITLSQSIKLQSQNARSQQEFDAAMVKYLNGPVILEVSNLADGTSAEDVKTAFADFGEIQECTTEEGARQGNQPTLKAKMIFTNKEEAEKAVEALNGALADGLMLAVKIIGRPTKRPDRADFMTATSGSEAKRKLTTIDTITKSQSQEDVAMKDGETAPTPTVPTGRLRSEVVAQCDPRASIQVEPKPIPIYRSEKPKPVIRNMLSRVQAFPGTHPTSAHHHAQNRNGFGTSSQLHAVNHTQDIQSHKSLLARIKPN